MKPYVLIPLLLLALVTTPLAQQDRSDEVSRLLTGLNSTSTNQRINAAKVITRSGLRDAELYQRVSEIIENGYFEAIGKKEVDELSWMCKALAASGDPQYKPLLDEVARNAANTKLQHYARQSLDLFDKYVERNRILNTTENWDEALTDEENRIVNLLRADDLALKRDGAKNLVRAMGLNAKLFDIAAGELESLGKEYRGENLWVDTVAWLCKAVAASGDSKYRPMLEQLVELAGDNPDRFKLKNYAKQALESL